MKVFSELKKNLKKDFSGFRSVKVAILGDTATQFLAQALKGEGYEQQLDLLLWEADYNQIEGQVLDPGSSLYDFDPEIIILFRSSHKLLQKYGKLDPGAYNTLADKELELIDRLTGTIWSRSTAKIIYYNYNEIDDTVFGDYANKTEMSFLFQLRKLNYELMKYASQHLDFYICDISSIQNRIGRRVFFQPSVYVNTDMVLSLDVLPEIAHSTLALIGTLKGKFLKCVILDLDNTTWGGIIGDDGMENIQIGSLGIGKAFTEFQYWIKKLKNRGIIICVCSKNTESVARQPFKEHKDMVLQMEDISVFVANWENKADNIRYIKSVLNIGFDSMVFLDDNPFERAMVRENIPGIIVPDLPEDPAEYLEYLYAQNLFGTASFSNEDKARAALYQVEERRKEAQMGFTNEDEFLKSLNMQSLVEPFTKYNTPRVAQLSQRSNQFNLRTIRYTEADIGRIASSDEYFPLVFSLEDNFGDNGIIAVVILKIEAADTLFIDTWFMSCRVLKRGMENFALNTISSFAKEKGFIHLKGQFIPTPKNDLVKDHYQNLGFTETGAYWYLNLNTFKEKKCFIQFKSSSYAKK